jgi:hypothetical protein
MFRIFAGSWRGPDISEKKIYINLDVKFREILYKFKGAKLSVLIYLALRMDENGESYPSYDLMEKETGYSRPVLSTAIKELCETLMDGKTILMRWREKDELGHFTGSTHYKLFPNPEECKEKPELEKAACGKTSLEVEPKNLKQEPISQNIKPRKTRPADIIHDSLVLVTGFPAGSFNGSVTSMLRKALPDKTPEWIASEIEKRFNKGGPWYRNDFRGRKDNKPPNPMQVFQEWDRVLIEKDASQSHMTAEDARKLGYD